MVNNCTHPCKVYGNEMFSHQCEEAFYTNFASVKDSEIKRAMAVPSAPHGMSRWLLEGK